MEMKYWYKTEQKYVPKAFAQSRGMRGIKRRIFVTKDELIKGNGLPLIGLGQFNCDYYVSINGEEYQIIHPTDGIPSMLTLEDWAGEIIPVIKNHTGQGVLDLNTGKLLVPFNRNHHSIYPISKDYFCIVDPTLDNKKIVNRSNIELDSIYGTYVRHNGKISRHKAFKNKPSQCIVDGEISLNSLKRKESTIKDRQNLINCVENLKNAGVSLSEINKIVNKTYNKENNITM